MDFESSALIASLVVSSIGFVVFVYGKRQQRVPLAVVGLALMGFPYFVPSVAIMGAIAGVLLIGLWLTVVAFVADAASYQRRLRRLLAIPPRAGT